MSPRKFAILLCIPVVWMAALAVAEKNPSERVWYRYKDDKGGIVIDDSIPPQFARQGYDIVNSAGQVLETVPRQLTSEELANLSDEEASARREKEAEEEMRRWDESLLRRYSTIADIEAARDRNIRELEIRLSILRGNVRATKLQIERQREKAADLERAGRTVHESLVKNINALQGEIALAEESIQARIDEIDKVKSDYQKDIDRFRYLLDVKGYRRN